MSAAEKLAFLLDLQEQCGGAIPFDRWMEAALYHPAYGYYTATIRGLGRRGDFTTWPLLDRSLARAIARWVKARRPAHIIEVGAGTGALAEGVLKELGWWKKPRYHIVEISPVLRQLQADRLGRMATWHASMCDALTACGGHALIFSNELVDAFPCRVFQKTDTAWSELFLRIDGARFVEEWRPSTPPATSAFACEWPTGQRVEVQESYRQWLGQWSDVWLSGAMLTIDYGGAVPALHRQRPLGTLRAYAHQQRLEGREVYQSFGLRDLTVDVNFSDLLLWAGAARTELSDLNQFLARQGECPPPEFAPAGAAFQVLVQER